MMQVTNFFKERALAAAKGLTDTSGGIPIPGIDGHYVIQRGRHKDRSTVVVILEDDQGNEFEIYTNGDHKV